MSGYGNNLTLLLYISESYTKLTDDQVREIAQKAGLHNAKKSITGVLMYSGGHFVQVLEGAEHSVDTLYQKICDDRRHHSVRTVLHSPIKDRMFEQWSMGVLESKQKLKLNRDRLYEAIRKLPPCQSGKPIPKAALAVLGEFRAQLPRLEHHRISPW